MALTAYEQKVYDAAVSLGLAPAEVLARTYPQIARGADVTLGADGASPGDFHYEQIKRAVAAALRRKNRADSESSLRTKAIGALKTLAEFLNVTIEPVTPGDPGDGWIMKRG